MGMVLSVVGFLLVTALAVYFHLRRRDAGPPRAAAPTGPPCPRCRAAVPAGSAFCPGCGVPLQVYDIVAAPEAEAGGGGEARLHAVVRADVCVGCGTCVGACPEPGAIELHGKIAVVETALCKGHGKCVEACPVGGILLATGDAVHRVEVPDVGVDFMSNVPGIFIVGELGGRGLIKNAINEGKLAIEGIAATLGGARAAAGGAGPDPRVGEVGLHPLDEPLDVLIVGAGPAGMSAGLEAHRRNLRYLVLEQGELGDTIRKYPRDKLVLGEPVRIPLYGDLWVADSSKETLLEVWETIAANTGLALRTGHRVDGIRRSGDMIEVLVGDGRFLARRVVLAMGRRGTPRRLGVPGEALAKVFYEVIEMEVFRGKRVLVVGGGDSAIESALGAANQEGTEVDLTHRGADFGKAKERNREKLAALVARGRVRVHYESRVLGIDERSVRLASRSGEIEIPNDYVVVRIGGEPPFPFLQRIGIRMVVKEVPIAKSREAAHA